MPDDLKYLLALHAIPGMGNAHLTKLLEGFESAQEAWDNVLAWKSFVGRKAEELLLKRREIHPDLIYEQYLASDCQVVCWRDPDYPELLRHIYDPPYLLYYKGTLPDPAGLGIAIVGSRNTTRYGLDAARWFGEGLDKHGVTVISGMARGIDAAAHQGALKAGGNTVAVLGCGVDVCYPKENQSLYRQIPDQGAVISQFPLSMPPLSPNFPVRNAIISGLAQGILVVEAGERSGTSITVNYGLEQGKEIFALPGPIFSANSAGPHRMIKDQVASLATEPEDILERFTVEVTRGQARKTQPASEPKCAEEEQVRRLFTTPIHFDEACRELDLKPEELLPKLFLWQMMGMIRELPGKYYVNKE